MNLKDAADSYAKATAEFLKVAQELSEAELDSSSSRGWTARQVIHHVADSEAQSYARLRRLIAEPGTQIQGYDEAGWGENETLGYKVLPIVHSLNVFIAVRASSLEIIKRLKPTQLENQLSKDQIFESYLNTIYFGRGSYGVMTASQQYFNFYF